jgi:hypothetical protein
VDVASEFNLEINVNKTTEMSINTLITKKQITQGQEVEVGTCHYLGSPVTKTRGSGTDIAACATETNNAFIQLWPIWKSSYVSVAGKLCIFNTDVKSVLLDTCETRKHNYNKQTISLPEQMSWKNSEHHHNQ